MLSSKIEGTQASLSDLLFFEAGSGSEQRTGDVKQVADYIRALEYALKQLKEIPLSARLFREIHKVLISDPTKASSEFRTSLNWIGFDGCNLSEASYAPPPAENWVEHMFDLEIYLLAEVLIQSFKSFHPMNPLIPSKPC